MKSSSTSKTIAAALLASALMFPLTGCDRDGPLEDAGEEIEDAVEDAGDAAEDAAEEATDGG